MLNVSRIRTISKLALPIAIALSSTMLMALIDLAMVGTLGSVSVAAVGLAGFSSTLIFSFMLGLAPAVQGFVARRRGEGIPDAECVPLNAAIVLAVLLAVPLTIIFYFLTPFFFGMIASDPEVIDVGVPYLQVLYLGMLAVGLNSAFRGFWSAIEKPQIHMYNIIVMACLNIVLNYILIFGKFGAPALGATGAAIGTTTALFAGAMINLLLGLYFYGKQGLFRFGPSLSFIARIFQRGLPATVQEFLYSAGYIVFLWMVGIVGTAELAAASALVRITMLLVFLAMSLGSASATLVSRELGRGNPEEAYRWGWDSGKLGIILITALGLPLLAFPEWFLSIFLTDPGTVAIAIIPLQLIAVTTGIGSLIYIFAYTLVSVGDGNRVMLISFSTQWLVFLPGVWIVGPYLGYGILEIWLVQVLYGMLSTVLITSLWVGGKWKTLNA